MYVYTKKEEKSITLFFAESKNAFRALKRPKKRAYTFRWRFLKRLPKAVPELGGGAKE